MECSVRLGQSQNTCNGICRQIAQHARRSFLRKVLIFMPFVFVALVFGIKLFWNYSIESHVEPLYTTTTITTSSPSYFTHTDNTTLITIDVSDKRRLGNLMLSYASLLGIAKRNHMKRVLSSAVSLKKIFHTSGMFADNINKVMGSHHRYQERNQWGCRYDPGTGNLAHVNTKLIGFFQSWRYFENVTEQLRREFTFRKEVQNVADNFHNSIHIQEWKDYRELGSKSQQYIKVGIHVRRGDFLYARFQMLGYTVADAGYFSRAMAYFTERYARVQFVVCSDDIGWLEQNIFAKQTSDTRVTFSRGHNQFEDLAILALCDHTIMSVGSFGWWAAWLAGGTTLYYKNWPEEHTWLSRKVDKKSYFPPEWIALS